MAHSTENNDWYVKEFESLSFGDERLKERFLKICASFDRAPGSIIRQAMDTAIDCKAAYRFWQNPKVTYQALLDSHQKSISSRVQKSDCIFEIQDSSELDFSTHLKKCGKGLIGRGISSGGFQTHTTLLVSKKGLPIGIGSFRLWARPPKRDLKGADVAKLPIREKESYKWVQGLHDVDAIDLKGCKRILIADREADFYEFLKILIQNKKWFIIRLKWDRKISDTSLTVTEQLDQQPFLGNISIQLDAKGGQFGRKAAELHLGVRFYKGDLLFSDKNGQIDPLKLTVVQAKEVIKKDTSEEWLLITNLPVHNFESACEIIQGYSMRWQIEDFFKLLKGAMKIEEVRLETKERVEKLITFLTILCYRLFWISRINRQDQTLVARLFFTDKEIGLVKKATRSTKELSEFTTEDMIVGIAKLGGYWGRKSDPPPGVVVIWRGWKRLQDIIHFSS